MIKTRESNSKSNNESNNEFSRLGLKGLLKELHRNGGGIMYKLHTIKWELKCAFSRAWLGYSSVNIFDLGSQEIDRLIVLLDKFKKNNIGLWICPEGYELGKYEELTRTYILTSEQIDIIIDTMIYHFKMSNEDYCEKVLYGKNIYDDDYDAKCRNIDDYKRISRITKQNLDLGMDLLKMFITDLWY